ncbi:MAG: prephenate dehydratase [Roseburia sp.]|nr:prephenate dehydratase [Roseburia sp.]
MNEFEKIRQDIADIDEKITGLYEERIHLVEKLTRHCPREGEELFGFSPVEQLDFEGADVVFQGVEGAYSQQALMEYFGKDMKSYHVDTWRDAMEAIAGGEADYAVLPIENSSAGIVSENFDLLVEYNNCIIGEQIIKIDHCLLGLEGTELSDITDVYSHPQALMQCSKYLKKRGWEKHSMKNTAGAAKTVKEENKNHKAAIASRVTADIYGLKVLAEGISNNTSNSTRFIIVTGKKIFQKRAGKISICFEIPHKSGSLYRTLSYFIHHNLTKIESRPIQGKTWEYRFFIDIEGSLMDESVRSALENIKGETEALKILGNY